MPDAYVKYQLSGSYIFSGALTPAIATVSMYDIVLETTVILKVLQSVENELRRDFYRGKLDRYISMNKHNHYKPFKLPC